MSMTKYREAIDKQANFQVCIMGKDPYPTDPIGVPFCKPDWESMMKDNCSGYHVLNSLGIDLHEDNLDSLKEQYSCPLDLFIHLLSVGVVFANLSHEFIGGAIRKDKHREQLIKGFQLNKPLLEKSANIILCGEAWKHRWYGEVDESFTNILHPDIRNRNNPSTSTCWRMWWSKGELSNWLELELEI